MGLHIHRGPRKRSDSDLSQSLRALPHRVTCTCCGTDYSIYEEDSLEEATEFYLDAGEKLSDYLERDEILFIRDEDIKPDERVGDVRKQGFVWVD